MVEIAALSRLSAVEVRERQPSEDLGQIDPSSIARAIHGITSFNISESVVVASKPRTSLALSVEGARVATPYSKGASDTCSRVDLGGDDGPLLVMKTPSGKMDAIAVRRC